MSTALPAQRRHVNGYAIASVAAGLVWLLGLGSLLALGLGMSARRRIRESNDRGEGLAAAGIVIGVVGLVLAVFFLLGIVLATSTSGHSGLR